MDPRFEELVRLAEIALCTVAFEDNGLRRPVKGLPDNAFSSQVGHVEMLQSCDRYLVF